MNVSPRGVFATTVVVALTLTTSGTALATENTTAPVPGVVTVDDGGIVVPDVAPVAAPDTVIADQELDALPLGTAVSTDPSTDPSTVPALPSDDAPPLDPSAAPSPTTTATVPDPEVRRADIGDAEVIGVSWEDETPESVEVRALEADGAWTEWSSLELGEGPTDGSVVGGASEPIFVGDATQVDVRVMRAGVAEVGAASLVTIDPAVSSTDAQIPAAFATAQTTAIQAGSVSVISRAQWGADPDLMTWTPAHAPSVQTAVLHHTAGSNDYSAADSARIIRAMYAYHSQTRGWGDLGYNVIVDKYGQVFEGRAGGLDLPTIGAHAGGYNTGSFGVSMMGTYDTVVPSAALKDSVARIIAWKLGGSYQFDAWATKGFVESGVGTKFPAGSWVVVHTIFGHRDVSSTACPGNAGYAFLPELRNRVNGLVGAHQTSIWSKWQAAGGAAALGHPFKLEYAAGVGSVTDYHRGDRMGSIVWSGATGTHVLIAALRDKWLAEGGVHGLGYPSMDESGTGDGYGSYADFLSGTRRGIILWSPSTGAQSIGGSFLAHWRGAGGVPAMGYPTTTESATPDGVGSIAHFVKGSRTASILWSAPTGTHSIGGPIRDAWTRSGGVFGLGYPTIDESVAAGGQGSYATFQRGALSGVVLWSSSTGATFLSGPAYSTWTAAGGTQGPGYPTTDEQFIGVGDSTYVPFVSGTWIVSNVGVGAFVVPAQVRSAWAARGGPTGSLGLPVGAAVLTGSTYSQAFSGGTVTAPR